MNSEPLPDGHHWLRLCDPTWADPFDASFAAARGGRWNSPAGHETLYLNEDIVTARNNVDLFIADKPYTVHDLRPGQGPGLVALTLPNTQTVVDAHTPDGVVALGLPATYPIDANGDVVPHDVCRPIGDQAFSDGFDGVRCRSAARPDGHGRELAWFTHERQLDGPPAIGFEDWYWK